VSLSELSQSFGVSDSTIRRDLEVLEEQGAIRRTHGGAVSLAETPSARLGFADRESTAPAEKRAIGVTIARMITDERTVIINGGTTCFQVGSALMGRRISLITNSVPIASLLGGDVNTEVTLIGGYLYPRTGVALGATAVEMLKSLRAEQAVISCAAVNEDGAFNVNEMMVAVERQMIAVADQVILAVDHTKFGKRSIAPLCPWGDIDIVVTDWGVDDRARAWLDAKGVRVVVAEKAG
jgi:DeoR/GlpR family transcriptional regulator of sugar metabolism